MSRGRSLVFAAFLVFAASAQAQIVKNCLAHHPLYIPGQFEVSHTQGLHYSVDYPDTLKDFGQSGQFMQSLQCGGAFGPNTTFCSTILK